MLRRFPLLLLLSFHSCHLILSVPEEVEINLCGNGILEEGEECDIETFGGKTCRTEGFDDGKLICSLTCTLVTAGCRSNSCGDGVMDLNESCDGTDLGGKTCLTEGYSGGLLQCHDSCLLDTSQCTTNTSECGNGIREFGEACDGTDLNNSTCSTLGYLEGAVRCSEECTFDVSDCVVGGACGDGILHSNEGEVCDGTDLGGATCSSLGYYGGTLECDTTCSFDLSSCEERGRCGDGVLQSDEGEACDGTDMGGTSCSSLGYYGGTLTCDANCAFDLTDCATAGRCGDGILQLPHEECEGADVNGATCDSLASTHGTYPGGGPVLCSDNCLYDLSNCMRCGDGVLNGEEQCDGTNFGGATCATNESTMGNLSCTSTCTIDFSNCRGTCRDGYDTLEECDGNELGGATCATSGLGVGPYPLVCDWGCGFTGCNTFQPLVAGDRHTCKIGAGGALYCWGENSDGQLGCSSHADHHLPAFVHGHHTFVSVSCGGKHTCGITSSGALYCWGSNSYGQLGEGSQIPCTTPTLVHGHHTFVSVSGGGGHTCGITSSGALYCWGSNAKGQLGDGSKQFKTSPTLVHGNYSFTTVSASGNRHTCGITSSGALYCWGLNETGQLGDGSFIERTTPTPVLGNHTFTAVSAGGERHTCGITSSGTLLCWGQNYYGQLGNGSGSGLNYTAPVAVSGGYTFVAVSGGRYHTCGITTSGTLLCWGRNTSGQLGDGSTTNRFIPTLVHGNHTFISVSTLENHTCGVTTSGTHLCWGLNSNGQLGSGTTNQSNTPQPVSYW